MLYDAPFTSVKIMKEGWMAGAFLDGRFESGKLFRPERILFQPALLGENNAFFLQQLLMREAVQSSANARSLSLQSRECAGAFHKS